MRTLEQKQKELEEAVKKAKSANVLELKPAITKVVEEMQSIIADLCKKVGDQ